MECGDYDDEIASPFEIAKAMIGLWLFVCVIAGAGYAAGYYAASGHRLIELQQFIPSALASKATKGGAQ